VLASLYAQEYKADSAIAALRVADSLEPTNPWNRRYLISVRAVMEQYDEAERLLRTELEAAPLGYRTQAKWDLAVVLRQTGRLREALTWTRRYRAEIGERIPAGTAPYNALHEGQVLFELGQYASAAALFDSIARGQARGSDPLLNARDQGWAWVHEADARAALGDTARLRFLADSMEVLGRVVAHARDRRLHAHVRGLLARVQGRDEEAARWFTQAMVSPVLGFTRSNYELAGALMRRGRPAHAIGPLRSAIHGGTDGSTLYVTRTELQARFAQAFDAAGEADSARYYYDRVLRHWRDADAEFAPRRDSLLLALERLRRADRP
jgi:tetratricopeptide (TPR) repeat protein